MLPMLTCFNLQPETSIDEFRQSIVTFTSHLPHHGLIQSGGPIGRRQRDTIMDTDAERDHEYFFMMSFRDRAQSDLAIEHIFGVHRSDRSVHKTVHSKIKDEVFICWEDPPEGQEYCIHCPRGSLFTPRRHAK
jgi:hypothetical protein